MRNLSFGLAALAAMLASPAMSTVVITAGAGEGASDDPFEGATVGATSPILAGFNAADAFGAITPDLASPYGEAQAGGHVIFDNSPSTGAFIEFSTAAPVTIAGFVASVSSDGTGNAYRGFSSFNLFGSTDGVTYAAIDGTSYDPSLGGLTLTASFDPVTYQYFRVEGFDNNGGARLLELDGVAAVPEPATWAMMIGGFGLLGGALRRRHRAVAAFA